MLCRLVLSRPIMRHGSVTGAIDPFAGLPSSGNQALGFWCMISGRLVRLLRLKMVILHVHHCRSFVGDGLYTLQLTEQGSRRQGPKMLRSIVKDLTKGIGCAVIQWWVSAGLEAVGEIYRGAGGKSAIGVIGDQRIEQT